MIKQNTVKSVLRGHL